MHVTCIHKEMTNSDGTPETAPANAADNAGGIQVSLSYGTSSSQSNSANQSDSTVAAGGITTIKVTGGGENSNLTIQGSDESGKAVNLEVDNAVNLLTTRNTTVQNIDTSGIGVTAGASVGKGNGNASQHFEC
jgi:filamentous hemagglutinin